MRVAIYDFDGTIYAEETFKLLMKHLKGHPVYQDKYPIFYRAILFPYLASKVKLYSKAKMRAKSMQLYLEAFTGLDKQAMSSYFEEFREAIQVNLNKQVIATLHKHHQEDVQIYLVSGAYTQFLEQVIVDYPFQKIIGTEIKFTADKVDTSLPLEHVNGPTKAAKIQELLADKEIDWENSYAYGDSYSDLHILELVGNPVAVRPEEKLRQVAVQRGWSILE